MAKDAGESPPPGEGAPTTRSQPEEPSAPEGKQDENQGPLRRRVFGLSIAGLLLGLGVILALSSFSMWYTSRPGFCETCHPMKRYVASWEKSSHQDVNCERCHTPPGVLGFVGGKIAGMQVVLNYARGKYEDWSYNAFVSNGSCLQCHEGILDENIHSSGVEVSHLNIVEAGGKCMNCHSTIAHGDEVRIGSATHPSMQNCLTCHNDQTAPLDCNLCHVGRRTKAQAEGGKTARAKEGNGG